MKTSINGLTIIKEYLKKNRHCKEELLKLEAYKCLHVSKCL
jgi:hypothetical protein